MCILQNIFKTDSNYNLTVQEIFLVELIIRGHNIIESATRMAKSIYRIKQIRSSVIKKIQAKNINHAIAIILSKKIEQGFISSHQTISSEMNNSAVSYLNLTHNETLSLCLAAQGLSIQESALILCKCNDRTKQIRASAIQKLHANNMTHAIAIAILKMIITVNF